LSKPFLKIDVFKKNNLLSSSASSAFDISCGENHTALLTRQKFL